MAWHGETSALAVVYFYHTRTSPKVAVSARTPGYSASCFCIGDFGTTL